MNWTVIVSGANKTGAIADPLPVRQDQAARRQLFNFDIKLEKQYEPFTCT
jgi:hypothetical protein